MSTIEEVSQTKRKIALEIPVEEVKPVFEEAISSISKGLKLKGFRPGKIPRGVVLKQCLPQIRNYLIEKLVTPEVYKGLEEHSQFPLNNPTFESLDINEDQPIKCTAFYDIYPVFELPPLEEIELTRYNSYVSDDEIQAILEDLQQKQATVKTLEEDRPAENGDLVDFSFTVFHDDRQVSLKKSDNTSVTLALGSQQVTVMPEIEAALFGMKIGETKDVPLTMPENTSYKNIAGKPVTFKITVNSIRMRDLPPIDDEFAVDTSFSGVTDLKTLKDYIFIELQKNKEDASLQRLHNDLLYALSEKAVLEVPESLLQAETDAAVERYKKNLSMNSDSSIDLNQYVTDGVIEALRRKAESSIKSTLIMNKIKSQFDIAITDEEIDKELMNLAYVTGQPLDVIKKFNDQNSTNYQSIKNRIEYKKALDFVCAKAKITEADQAVNLSLPADQEDLTARLLRDLEAETEPQPDSADISQADSESSHSPATEGQDPEPQIP
ncbi:MAG: trigger factor [Deltaproteobacteria bacterium]|nr:trigger factor [Deltaproteobacteria bacterium]